MPLGPGKFDPVATQVREQTGAEGVVLLVLGAPAGSGFSVQGPLELTLMLPDILENLAREIRASFQAGQV